jgi:hypothetical protein
VKEKLAVIKFDKIKPIIKGYLPNYDIHYNLGVEVSL